MTLQGVQPPESTLPPAKPDWGVTPAGFWIRLVAIMVDSSIFGFILFIISLPLSAAMLASGYVPGGETAIIGPVNIVSTLITACLEAAFVSSFWQASPGKRLMGIIVVGERGERISFARAFARYFGKLLSTAILFLGYVMIAFTEQKTGLHDLLCSTRVIYGKK